MTWGVLVERRWFTLRHATVPVLTPGSLRPLRVLHLSDLHLLPGRPAGAEFLRRCAATAPDMLVATGDFLGDPAVVDQAVRLLRDVAGGRPAVAVLGSNDRFGPVPKSPLRYFTAPADRRHGGRVDTARLVGGLRDAGWTVLCNERVRLVTPAGVLDVAGLDDPHIAYDRPERIDWAPPRDGDVPVLRLAVVHAPYRRALDVFDRHGFDLALAGHTHGGQVRLPGIGALTANCDLPLRQARGLSRWGADLWLHVSAGLGHSRYAPFRFACRPEATLLDLVPSLPHDRGAPTLARLHRDVAQLG